MRISSLPQIYRNVKRWSEIVSVLSKYGLAGWLSRTNIDFVKDSLKHRDGESLARQTPEARIRLALTELGPTHIKLGQLLSTRPDLVGHEIADELRQLQSAAPADSPEQVRATVEKELGLKVEEAFAEFAFTPVASASIGQVHRARLKTGERVVVKVQHAGIEAVVNEDLDVLTGLATLAEQFPEFARYRPVATVTELARTLRRELDFRREQRNLIQFAKIFERHANVHIPKAYPAQSSARVLTMEEFEGVSISDQEALKEAGYDTDWIARQCAEAYINMIFVHGIFHADPHPGNILALPGSAIGLIDFGMVGRIDDRLREAIEVALLAIAQQDVHTLCLQLRRIGRAPPNLDEAQFASDVSDFVSHYSTQPLEHFDLSGALTDMVDMIRRYEILLPPSVALLIKVLVTLEGSAKALSPKFSLMEIIVPLQKQMLWRRWSPVRQARKMQRLVSEIEQLIEVLPQRLIEILDQVQEGKFDVHLDHRGLGPSVNRLVLGMLASALFVGSSLMMAYSVPPVLFHAKEFYFGIKNLSLLGLVGSGVSIVLGLRLIRAIGKSGHLDQK